MKFVLILTCGLFATLSNLSAQVPFHLIADRADAHIMAYFSGDAEFNAIEAFVYTKAGADPFIRAIMSRRDGSQIDVLNHPATGRTDDAKVFGRKSLVEPIELLASSDGLNYSLAFRLPDQRLVTFKYVGTGAPEKKYGGLTDIGNHSSDGGLPLIYRESSSMGSADSSVKIGSTDCVIELYPELSNPFFTARKAFLTLGMQEIIFPVFDLSDASQDLPPVSASGEVNFASQDPRMSETAVRLPVTFHDLWSLGIGETKSDDFSVWFQGTVACTGKMIVTRPDQDHLQINLNPVSPAWAAESRKLIYLIERSGQTYHTISKMNDRENVPAKAGALDPSNAHSVSPPNGSVEKGTALSLGVLVLPNVSGDLGRVQFKLDSIARLNLEFNYLKIGGQPSLGLRSSMAMGSTISNNQIRIYGGPEIGVYAPWTALPHQINLCASLGGLGGVEFKLSETTSVYFEFGGGYGYNGYAADLTPLFDSYIRGGLTLVRF